MKVLGAILALIGILALGAAAIEHFNPVFSPNTPHLSIYIGAAGVIALVLGAVLARAGSD